MRCLRRWGNYPWFVILLVGPMLLGCGGTDEPEKAKVSGNVTLDGKPLADGEVTFVTVAQGVRETFPVKDGTYEGEAQLGDRQVEVRAYREAKAATDMYGTDAPVSKENYIPAKYNANSTLKASVTSEGPNKFDFDVTSK